MRQRLGPPIRRNHSTLVDRWSQEIVCKQQNGSLRLVVVLQGDVGSGKTAVAFLALLAAVGSGQQGALMAPTETLATQHSVRMAEMLAALPEVMPDGRPRPRAALMLGGVRSPVSLLSVPLHLCHPIQLASEIDDPCTIGTVDKSSFAGVTILPELCVLEENTLFRCRTSKAECSLEINPWYDCLASICDFTALPPFQYFVG